MEAVDSVECLGGLVPIPVESLAVKSGIGINSSVHNTERRPGFRSRRRGCVRAFPAPGREAALMRAAEAGDLRPKATQSAKQRTRSAGLINTTWFLSWHISFAQGAFSLMR